VRHTLTEAALLTIRAPGPMRPFHERVRARRGHQIATVAVARKLAVLFWHLLTRSEDSAYGSPTLTQKKIRQMEVTAGAPSRNQPAEVVRGVRPSSLRSEGPGATVLVSTWLAKGRMEGQYRAHSTSERSVRLTFAIDWHREEHSKAPTQASESTRHIRLATSLLSA